MNSLFRLTSCLLLAVLLVSCAATEKRNMLAGEPPQGAQGNYKYDAWRPDTSGEYEAINVLLDEADVLIARCRWRNAATALLFLILNYWR